MINSDRPMPPLEGVEHRWVTVRGARLHIAESGTGEPVVLLHGFPQHWYAWCALVPLLADGHRLICVDLRGFGWSEQTERGYDTDGLGDDILALLDELGLDRHWPALTRYLLRRAVADPTAWRDADLTEFAEAAQASAHAGQAMFWQYVVRDIPAGFRGTHRRRRLTVPTLVLGGEHDPVIPPALLRGGAPDADDPTVRVVPGAGHHLHEERPELVAEALRKLIARTG
ncbi:alpha/beta fold hydrolase [Streptomyces inhibens]|uniref:alpha/beta fold hydrolase n=1 Tax=Streptomyces inhibens TaxID=2293571 RepID=UPI00402A6025